MCFRAITDQSAPVRSQRAESTWRRARLTRQLFCGIQWVAWYETNCNIHVTRKFLRWRWNLLRLRHRKVFLDSIKRVLSIIINDRTSSWILRFVVSILCKGNTARMTKRIPSWETLRVWQSGFRVAAWPMR